MLTPTRRDDLSSDLLSDNGGAQNPQGGGKCPRGTRWDPGSQSCVPKKSVIKNDPRCGLGMVYDGTLGRCVTRGTEDTWSPRTELNKLEAQRERIISHRLRVRAEGLGNRQVEGREEPDPFLFFELSMAILLANQVFKVADELILPIYDQQVLPDNSAFFNGSRLADANLRAEQIWRNNIWDQDLEDGVARIVGQSFAAGEAQVVAGITRGSNAVQQVLDNMVKMTDFRTNAFYNDQILPMIQNKVTQLFETGEFERINLNTIRQTLDRRLKSVPYWRVTANANASRAYHYGLLKAARSQGFTGYEYVAIIDSRTSDICRSTDGRQWHIADALNKYEQVAGSDDPDEVKRVFPWVSVEEIENLDDDAVKDLGVLVPPLHGNCRSTLRPI